MLKGGRKLHLKQKVELQSMKKERVLVEKSVEWQKDIHLGLNQVITLEL
jgi:hypothetical protein